MFARVANPPQFAVISRTSIDSCANTIEDCTPPLRLLIKKSAEHYRSWSKKLKSLKLAVLAATLLPLVSRAQSTTQPFACGQAAGVWAGISIRSDEYFQLPPRTTFIRAAHYYCTVTGSKTLMIGPNLDGIFMVLRTNVQQQIPIYKLSNGTVVVTGLVTIDAVPTWNPMTTYTDDVVYYNGAYWVVAQPSTGITPGSETTDLHWLPQPALQP
jgi:hypothetical protein